MGDAAPTVHQKSSGLPNFSTFAQHSLCQGRKSPAHPTDSKMKPNLTFALRSTALAFATLLCLAAEAQPTQDAKRSGPPEQAIAACKALQAGNECSFTANHGNVTGTCFAPQGKPLACRPKNAPEKTPDQSVPPKN